MHLPLNIFERHVLVSFLGLLNYYQPFAVLNPSETGQWPVKNIAVLVTFAVVAWGAGGVWFARRDLCTV